jgi:Clp amino terminal domain, pathogenicity island component
VVRLLGRDQPNTVERFDDDAQRALTFAQEEARLLAHTYIGTEHLLLGLLDAASNEAADVLTQLGVCRQSVWQAVLDVVGRGRQTPVGFVLLTPRARVVLETAADYRGAQEPPARIRPMDILVGLLDDPTSMAVRVLDHLEVDTVRTRLQFELIPDVAEIWRHTPIVPFVRASCPQCRAILATALTTTTITSGCSQVRITHCGACGWTLDATPIGNGHPTVESAGG